MKHVPSHDYCCTILYTIQIKQDNMLVVCTCAGVLKTLMDVEQLTTKLRAFRGIAEHFGMPLLLQNVDWVLQMNPVVKK